MKRMLIDDTQPEETRVVIVDGNKVEDVEFESTAKKQIKGNIFTAKIIRIEPSLQAAFIDYGGNRHGFLAFGEIHPDYYNISDEVKAEVEAEVDEIIERKRQYQIDRKAEQERRRLEREQKRAEYEAMKRAEAEAQAQAQELSDDENNDEDNIVSYDDSANQEASFETVVNEFISSDDEVVSCDEQDDCSENDDLSNGDCKCSENEGKCNCGCNGDCKCSENEGECNCGCNGDCKCSENEGECNCGCNGDCKCSEKEELESVKNTDCCGCSADCECRKADGICHCKENGVCTCSEECHCCDDENITVENITDVEANDAENDNDITEETSDENIVEDKSEARPRRRGNRFLGRRSSRKYKVSAESAGLASDEVVSEKIDEDDEHDEHINANDKPANDDDFVNDNNDFDNDEDDDFEHYLEIQRKLIFARKLYHRSSIQDVIKEGQTVLVQVVKEERGNKGAACTTYLSLAGRYCVLMPNRIRSGGVSRKITSAQDRKRLKEIIKGLPLNDNMSLIVRTAGEDKKKEDIVRDYNYLIRSWNHIRHSALSVQAPALIYEEGNLIKRALRDMYTKDIAEVIIDGDNAYKMAKDFSKILSPNMSKKIKCRKPDELPVFQHYQVEKELDKLHNPVVQLASGGYLVINPTEALVSIDVNSGRATHEMDIEETALRTNLEAADEIAKQLRMRNLAGLVVVDFIDMDEPANNHAVEKRMKEAMKPDRARVQIAKMSIFGLLEISRQRMHSSFVESNYVTCPYCKGQGVQRTVESSATLVLRAIEEEGIKGAYNHLEVKLPQDIAVYLLNHKRRILADLEEKYELEIIISADSSIKNISEYRIEKCRKSKPKFEQVAATSAYDAVHTDDCIESDDDDNVNDDENDAYSDVEDDDNRSSRRRNRFERRRDRRNNRSSRRRDRRNFDERSNKTPVDEAPAPVVEEEPKEKKKAWWKKLLS
jgi:ribonuclease E